MVKTKEQPTFTRRQLMESRRYRDRRDIIAALFMDGEEYTLEQVETLLGATTAHKEGRA